MSRSRCLAALVLAASSVVARGQDAPPTPIRVLAIVDPALTDLNEGITQGIQETERTATLLGRQLQVTREGDTPALADGSRPGLLAIISADSSLVDGKMQLQVPVVDVSPDASARPGAGSAWVFCIRAERPGTEWKPDLTRFGAGELNERYERNTGRAMTAEAWVGWFAVKAVVEAALRADARDPAALADALRELRFDGHKGEPLYFDEHQRLVQPVY